MFQRKKAAAVTLCSPFLESSTFSSLVLSFPLWNNLIQYVQKWLVKMCTCQDDSSCGELDMSRGAAGYTWWVDYNFLAISSVWISKFRIINCQVIEFWYLLDLDEQENLQMNLIHMDTKCDTILERKGLSSCVFFLHMLSLSLKSHSNFLEHE